MPNLPKLTEPQIRTLFQIVDGKLHRRLLDEKDAEFMQWNTTRAKKWNAAYYHSMNNQCAHVYIIGFSAAHKYWIELVLVHGAKKADRMITAYISEQRRNAQKKGHPKPEKVIAPKKRVVDLEPPKPDVIRSSDLFGKSRPSISANAVMSGWSVYG